MIQTELTHHARRKPSHPVGDGSLQNHELIVDLFAGGGGASTGIYDATGRHPDIAVNHSAAALAVHAANHPATKHFREDVFDVNPREVCGGSAVGLLWMSPDCFPAGTMVLARSGYTPIEEIAIGDEVLSHRGVWRKVTSTMSSHRRLFELRGHGHHGLLVSGEHPFYARRRVDIWDEDRNGYKRTLEPAAWVPVSTLDRGWYCWSTALRALGYAIEHRLLVAADYGAPTTRKRLFLVARRDGHPIVWPEPSHGKGRTRPWRTAAEIINWSLVCPSIFARKKPLADATCARIGEGMHRHVLTCAQPFIVPLTHQGVVRVVTPFIAKFYGTGTAIPADEPLHTVTAGGQKFGLVIPTLIQTGYGERPGQAPRVPGLDKPIGTMVNGGKHALVAFITKHYGGVVGHEIERPLGTVTTQDHHSLTVAEYGTDRTDEVVEFLLRWCRSTPSMKHIEEVRERGLLPSDIGMRMLAPRELFRAQSFPDSYRIDIDHNGKPLSKTAQIELAGNSVCPPMAAAIVRANVCAEQARMAS